ncbi:MAG: hypothetical protein NC212_02740 [Staphylococcus sp.]|nr:hypothetical protein [Staphylococcus sp.]
MKRQNTKGATKKNLRPVSEKFYKSLNERAMAAANVAGKPLLGTNVMLAVDAYINEGVLPSGESVELMLILTLLKPEIDKAMARSAAARSRRRARAAETPCQESIGMDERVAVAIEPLSDDGPEPAPELPVAVSGFIGNRRERRRQEQEQRRLAKRLLRWTR